VVYAIIFANFGQVFLLIALALMCLPVLANVVRVPMNYLIPSVLALAIFGSFGLVGSMSRPLPYWFLPSLAGCLGAIITLFQQPLLGFYWGVWLKAHCYIPCKLVGAIFIRA